MTAELEEVASLPHTQALLLAGRLEDEGIEAHVDPPEVGAFPGYPYGGHEPDARVLVRGEDVDRARPIAREILGG